MPRTGFLPHPKSWAVLFGIILVAATIFAYRPAWHGGFIWDDDEYVVNNRLLTAPDGLQRIWFSFDSPSQYFPLTYTTFRIERAFWGLNPTGYHLINILFHAANALLVWWLLTRLKIPGAWLAAGIFALHPVHVESVAWITERKNVLMGFFFLLTLITWTKFLDERKRGFYILALILYLLALFAKSTACTLPAALLLILWLRKDRIDIQRLLQVTPFAVLGLAMGLLAVWWERFHQGTHGTQFALGPLERIMIASRAPWFYLGKLLWPINLTFIYPRWDIAPGNLISYVWLLAGIGFCVGIYFARRYVGRSVEVAAAFFVTTLSPVIGFIMLWTFIYTFVADHYQYLASIGPIALVSCGLILVVRRFGTIPVFCLSVLPIILGALTWQQCIAYSDIETLWRTTIRKNPGCWMAENNLGIVLYSKGRNDEAIAHYQRSLDLKSDFPQTHYNLCNSLLQAGDVDGAIAAGRRALELDPNDADAHTALGNALAARKITDEATAHYTRAVELAPFNSSAQYNLAIDLMSRHQTGEAIAHYEKALQVRPDFVEAMVNLAWLLATSHNEANRNGPRAAELAEHANYLSGGRNPLVLRALAAAYAETEHFDRAVEMTRRALQLAEAGGNSELADSLRREEALYESGSKYREP